jgi:uncharacterized membrane protein YhaH (DUF805 family)
MHFREEIKMFCPSCGEKLVQSDFNACPFCGTDLRRLNNKSEVGFERVSEINSQSSNPEYYKGLMSVYQDSLRIRTDGGISIKEYWLASFLHYVVYLVSMFLFGFVFGLIAELTGEISFLYFVYDYSELISNIFIILINIAIIGLGIRRMHDVGKSGWFILIPIYSFILSITPSKLTDNPYR